MLKNKNIFLVVLFFVLFFSFNGDVSAQSCEQPSYSCPSGCVASGACAAGSFVGSCNSGYSGSCEEDGQVPVGGSCGVHFQACCCPSGGGGSPPPPPPIDTCGDGSCNGGETYSSCSQDCSYCPAVAPIECDCGSPLGTVCTNTNCTDACGGGGGYCGDGTCRSSEGEDPNSCSDDCGGGGEGTSMSGTLTSSALSCTIPLGGTSCNVTLTWTTTNPEATSAVTSPYPSAGTTVFTGNSGTNQSVSIPYNSRAFYLYNNSVLLDQETVTANCTGGTTWNGSSCATTLPADSSFCVSINAPASVATGQVFSTTVTMQNTGSATWTPAGYTLTYPEGAAYPNGGSFGGPQQPPISPSSVPTNSNSTSTFNVTAPSTPGTYNLRAQMLHHGVAWFGAVCSRSVNVVSPSVTITPSSTSVYVGQTVNFFVNATSFYPNLQTIGLESSTSGGSAIANLGAQSVSGSSASGNLPWTATTTGTFYFMGYGYNGTVTRTAPVAVTVTPAPAVPTVTTPTHTSITTGGATLGANVTSLGVPAAISARGTCWGTSSGSMPNCLAQGGTTTGVFTHARTGMPSGTTIYYRGYATNTTGTGYSTTSSFVTTSANAVPTVTTPTHTSITTGGATLGANVTSLGVPAAISARGTCWGTTTNPTTNCVAASGTTTGVFTHARTGMPAGTTIYYRGYATNTTGTGYSASSSFTTTAVPTVVFPNHSSITTGGATLGANVTSLGVPAAISARGTCWGTTTNPTTNCVAASGTTTGVFTHARTGMSPGTTYYYRGYADNTTGRGYSASSSFTTTGSMSGTLTPSSSSCTIASGASSCTSSLLTWTTTNPVATSAVTNNGTATPSAPTGNNSSSTFTVPYNVAMSGVTSFYLYNNAVLLATATVTTSCTVGTTWNGSICAANAVPTVTTPTHTSITTGGATLGANVTSLGVPAAISARGTCWGTAPAPTTNCLAQGGTTTGVFTHARTGMPAGTLIYYRGYATNTTGTGYSVDSSFTTTSIGLPDLTADPSTPTTATVNVPLTFSATILNIGSASTGASFNNFFQVATASGGGGTISDLSSSSMPALGGGATNTSTSPSYTFTSTGTKSVRVCADKTNSGSTGVIAESNEGNNCGAWADVVVSNTAVPVVSISANPTSGTVNVVNPGLTWSATNSPTSCTASGDWSGAKPTSGTDVSQGVLTLVKTYVYTLVCSNAGGASAPASATVVVSGAGGTAQIEAAPPTIFAGGTTTLNWSSTASSCVGTNFDTGGAASGSALVSPVATTTYAVLCDGDYSEVTVVVKKKPFFIED